MLKKILFLIIYSNISYAQSPSNIKGKYNTPSNQDTCTIMPLESIKNYSLKEIAVKKNKLLLQHKIDRTVFDVSKSIAAIGTDAFTLICKAPNITSTNNQINMLGKGAVKIMINDRLILLNGEELNTYLKTIPSENIEAIEIISNPPANYDAAGNYGLVNIITKKNKTEGLNALLSLGLGQASYLNSSGAATINYLKKNINMQFSLSKKKGAYGPVEEHTAYYPTQTTITKDTRKDFQNNMHGQLDLEYKINNNNTLNFNIAILQSKPDIKEYIVNTIYNASNWIDSQINTQAFTSAKNRVNTINLNYQHRLHTLGSKVVVDADYAQYDTYKNRRFDNYTLVANTTNNTNISNFYTENDQGIKLFSLHTYCEYVIKKYTLKIGGKLSRIENKSNIGLYQLVGTQNIPISDNRFAYTEQGQAAFANMQRTFHKIDVQFGLRFENVMIDGNSMSDKISYQTKNIFPTAYFAYQLDDNNTLSINYGKRVERPGYEELNPFRWYFNPYSYSEGNPFLKPSYSHNAELSYTYAENLNIAIAYLSAQDVINQFEYLNDSNNIQACRYLNLSNEKAINIGATYTFTKIKGLESCLQVQGILNTNSSLIKEAMPEVSLWGASGSLNNNIYFNQNKTLLGNIDIEYQSNQASSLGTQRYASRVDLGIRILAIKKRLNIAVSCTDVFKTNVNVFKTYSSAIASQTNNYYDLRVLRIAITYKFGKQLKTKEKRDSQIEAEKNRVWF